MFIDQFILLPIIYEEDEDVVIVEKIKQYGEALIKPHEIAAIAFGDDGLIEVYLSDSTVFTINLSREDFIKKLNSFPFSNAKPFSLQ